MQSTYRLKANELDEQFIVGLKATYKDKEIEIIVYEVEDAMSEVTSDADASSADFPSERRASLEAAVRDETEYLLKSKANRKKLMQAKANIENQTNLVEVDLEDLA